MRQETLEPLRIVPLHQLCTVAPCQQKADTPQGHEERIRAHAERVAREEPQGQQRSRGRYISAATWRRRIALHLLHHGPKSFTQILREVGVPNASFRNARAHGDTPWFERSQYGLLWSLTEAGRKSLTQPEEGDSQCSTTA